MPRPAVYYPRYDEAKFEYVTRHADDVMPATLFQELDINEKVM